MIIIYYYYYYWRGVAKAEGRTGGQGDGEIGIWDA